MGQHRSRIGTVVAAASALVLATAAPAASQDVAASPSGLGLSDGTTSVLELALGEDLLALRLVGEDSLTSNDPAAPGPRALERLGPLDITSTLLPALEALSLPAVETASTDGEDATTAPSVDLATVVAGSPVPNLLTGTIDPATLRSIVGAGGAVSAAEAAIRDLDVLGGLVQVDNATANLGSQALVSDALAQRGLEIDHLEVLDLAALLDALGLGLGDLPLDAAVGLLDQLGLPLPAGIGALDGLLDQTSTVRGQVTALQAQIAPLASQLTSATALVSSLSAQLAQQQALLDACGGVPVVCAPIQALVTTLTGQLATAQTSVTDLGAAIVALQAQIDALLATITGLVDQLTGLLDGVLDSLEDAPLVAVDDLVVGATARADDTLATSAATVLGSVGDVRVGATSLGGLDATAALGQVTSLADQLTGALSGLLGGIDPALASVVDIDLFQQTTALTERDGGIDAEAAITGLVATVTPPDVCGLLGRLGGAQDTIGGILGGLTSQLPALPVAPLGEVLGAIGSTVACGGAAPSGGITAALTQPMRLEALSVAGTAFHAVAAGPATPVAPTAPGGTLPRTGGGAGLAVLAVALGAAGYGGRRLLARTT